MEGKRGGGKHELLRHGHGGMKLNFFLCVFLEQLDRPLRMPLKNILSNNKKKQLENVSPKRKGRERFDVPFVFSRKE
jgi:hypothetical protein